MTVGLLLIAHESLGNALLDTACGALGGCPLPTRVIAVPRDSDPEHLSREAREAVHILDQGLGVLVLTDIFGSTPGNIACSLLDMPEVRVVAGANLPMLIRVFNYPTLELDALAEKAVTGGCDGVVSCEAALRGEVHHA